MRDENKMRTKFKTWRNDDKRRRKTAFIIAAFCLLLLIAALGIAAGLLLADHSNNTADTGQVVSAESSADNIAVPEENANEDAAAESEESDKDNDSADEQKSKPKLVQKAVALLFPPRDIDPAAPMVALTFDDGPYSEVTDSILDTLAKYDGLATFFVVGSRLSWQQDTVKKAVGMGCEIGNHSYTHKYSFSEASDEVIREEIDKTDDALEELTGTRTTILRVPFGDANDTVKEIVGTPMIGWDLDTLDWYTRDPDSTIEKVKEKAHDGCIILMHDLYPETAKACEKIIPWLSEQGYQIVTVDEMMKARGVEMQNGEIYNKAPTAEEWQAVQSPPDQPEDAAADGEQ